MINKELKKILRTKNKQKRIELFNRFLKNLKKEYKTSGEHRIYHVLDRIHAFYKLTFEREV